MKHAWLFLLVACGGTPSPAPEPTPTEATSPETSSPETTEPSGGACTSHSSCASCVANGCRWTGGHCDTACLQDVACYEGDIACPAAEANLVGSWKQDHAQSADGVDVFVRGDVELPPARYRQRWTFESGGVLRASALAANDAHGSVVGRWRVSDSEHLVIELPDETQVWEIVALGDTLRVRRAN
ncbi:MAG: hypothetical protein H6720_21790 [Sandaracinus sp.]|nr:hypothetical protein [Sandaracinus sp.]